MHLTAWARLAVGMLALGASWSAGIASARAADKPCPVADGAFEYEPYIAKTMAALRSGSDVSIVAIGGASTEGRAAGGPEASWPSRFVEALKERYPQSRITLTIRAVARQTAEQMMTRFSREVVALKPTLVIWEAGTTDAVRGVDVDDFRDSLHAGIEALRPTGAEIVLMDMQYSPMTQSVVYFNRYLVILRGVADVTDTPLFPRHKIMYDWAEMGLLDSPDRNTEARRQLADWLYRCIGRAMADFVTRQPPTTTQQ